MARRIKTGPRAAIWTSLRIRQSLYGKLRDSAKKNGNSMNGEIVSRLERSLSGFQTGFIWRDQQRADFVARFGIEAYMAIPEQIREGAALK